MITVEKRLKLYREIAETYGRTQGAKEISEKYDVSKQYVQQIALKLRSMNLEIPKWRGKRGGGLLAEFVSEFKREKGLE